MIFRILGVIKQAGPIAKNIMYLIRFGSNLNRGDLFITGLLKFGGRRICSTIKELAIPFGNVFLGTGAVR